MNGYFGRMLIADLASRTGRTELLAENLLRKYVGGSGLGAYFLSRMVPPTADPLGPQNAVIFSVGPFCLTRVPTSGRHQVTTLSPLTGIFAESDVGGRWGGAFHGTGYEVLVITGVSDTPVSLLVTENGAEFEDASDVWGRDTIETYDHYQRKYPDSETACIGVAGERLVRISSLMHDGRHARAAGRCGIGAVLGSRKLKAVVAIPSRSLKKKLFDEAALNASTAKIAGDMPKTAEVLSKYGTAGTIGGAHSFGDLPVKNWALGDFGPAVEKISGQRLSQTGRLTKRYFCRQCTIGCGRTVRLSDGSEGAGPEYETAAMYGSNCLIDDMEIIIRANELSNRLGLDTISSGGVIAFLMEAYERGEMRGVDLYGIAPEWGKGEVLLRLIERIGLREGIGEILGEGVAKASLSFGAAEYAIHSKGLEFPAHDPRAFNTMGLSYATSNRGACHLQGMTYGYEKNLTFPERGFDAPQDRFGTDRKAELVARSQDLMGLLDSLKVCKFSQYGGARASDFLEWLNLATGWGMGMDEFLEAGERIFNLKRQFNVARGVSRKDDTLPERILREPKGGGAGQNLPPAFESSLNDYYRIRGWDANGVPEPGTLARLGLSGEVPV